MRIMQRVDDLDYAGKGAVPAKTVTAATHTVKLTWQVDGGKVQSAELDMTDEHLAEYDQHMYVLLHAYQVNNTRPQQKQSGDWAVPRPGEESTLAERRAYGTALRMYSDLYKIKALEPPERPAYVAPGGSRYNPGWLKRSYDHWLATGEVVLPRTAEEAREKPVQGKEASNWRQEFSKLDEAMQDGGTLNDPSPG